ncbi:hypothetical protein CFP56_008915 [Quercus suber]|uniref:Uncharacterized protein n=1 Tax=Quercus suber TaxID=58331 RepID=A0AAW0L5B6_QUESU
MCPHSVLYFTGESALEEKGDAVREWTSRRPYKEREKKKLKQGNCYFAVSPGVLTSRTYIYGSHSGVVELTRSEFYQTGCDSEISSQGYDKVNCKLKSVELSELWIFMPFAQNKDVVKQFLKENVSVGRVVVH